MIKTRIPERQKLILDNVSWDEYTRLLRNFERRHLRLTYDRGRLEIMTLSFLHEGMGRFLGRMVVTLTEQFNLSCTRRRPHDAEAAEKAEGLESDNCNWIAHEADVRNLEVINLRKDPPPDLALEVDITRSSMNRMRGYPSLNIPEVWRWNKDGLAFFVLNADGNYDSVPASPTFPLPISPSDLMPFITRRGQMDDNAVIREFRAWTGEKLAATRP